MINLVQGDADTLAHGTELLHYLHKLSDSSLRVVKQVDFFWNCLFHGETLLDLFINIVCFVVKVDDLDQGDARFELILGHFLKERKKRVTNVQHLVLILDTSQVLQALRSFRVVRFPELVMESFSEV